MYIYQNIICYPKVPNDTNVVIAPYVPELQKQNPVFYTCKSGNQLGF